jgi:hypothetical protein
MKYPATQRISHTVATAAAALLLASPLAVSAQTNGSQAPALDQINAIYALNDRYFDDVHYTKPDFVKVTAPGFTVSYPDGSKVDGRQLLERAATRNLQESGYQRSIVVNSITTDGSSITEDITSRDIANLAIDGDFNPTQTQTSRRTLTWVQSPDGNWQLASERINAINEFPYGALLNDW